MESLGIDLEQKGADQTSLMQLVCHPPSMHEQERYTEDTKQINFRYINIYIYIYQQLLDKK
jgi:hypothetical protein